jgi:integrase-like protein
VDHSALREHLSAVTQRAGLGHWHPHELRHSAVSLLSAAGVRLEDVADVMGHRSTRTTSAVYRHVVVPTINAAVAPVDSLFSASSDETAYNMAYDLAFTSPAPREAAAPLAAVTCTFAGGP